MSKIQNWFSLPWHLFLLPLFFVLHGIAGDFPLTLPEVIWFLAIHAGFALLLFLFFMRLLKHPGKAALPVFFVLLVQFFFGSFVDFLKENFGQGLYVRYMFLIPLLILLLTVLVLYLKRTHRRFIRLTAYLNFLFLFLVAWDATVLIIDPEPPHKQSLSSSFVKADHLEKPDVYLIVADEYAGNKQLKELFGFDNSEFERQLGERGFYLVENASSNYNFTVYSVASLLNMQYLRNFADNIYRPEYILTCRRLVYDNEVVRFFKTNGYSIHNFSFLDFRNETRAVTYWAFRPIPRLLMAHSFTGRFRFDLGHHFAKKKELDGVLYTYQKGNEEVAALLRRTAAMPDKTSRFVYTHLIMPHYPYYFDSSGNPRPKALLGGEHKNNHKAYIEYLVYANRELLGLVDHIKKHSARPPVILLLSDHGFRELPDSVDKKYHFMTLNAVHLPGGNYNGFYKGMSHVNLFRAVLNSQFGQQLQMLKDSSAFILGEDNR